MGFIRKAVKKSLKTIKSGLSRYSRSSQNDDSISCTDYEEPIYEEVTFLDSTETTLLSPLKHAETQTPHSFNLIEFSPNTPPPRTWVPFRKKSENRQLLIETPKPDSCSDSGISESSASKRKVKKLQFSSDLVQEFEIEPAESEDNMIIKSGQICKAKYYETESPQKVEIAPPGTEIYLSFAQIEQNQVQMITLPRNDTIDQDKYKLSPPKPTRSAYRMKKIQEQRKLLASSESEDNASPNFKALKPILRYRDPRIITSSSEDEMPVIPKYKETSEVVYAKVIPRSSRNLSTSGSISSPEPTSSPECSREDILSKESLPTLPRSEDFLPEASSSFNNILEATVKKSGDVWSLNNFLSDQSQRTLCNQAPSPEKTQSANVLSENAKNSKLLQIKSDLFQENRRAFLEKTLSDNVSSESTAVSLQKATCNADCSAPKINNVLSESTRESLNLIHNTKWSLDKESILKSHDCHKTPKSPSQSAVESKFVVNAYESRKSLRRFRPIKPSDTNMKINTVNSSLGQEHQKSDKTVKIQENDLPVISKENEIESSGSSVDSERVDMLLSDASEKHYFSDDTNNHADGNNNTPSKDLRRLSLYTQQNMYYKHLRLTKDQSYKIMAEASHALEEVNRSGKRNVDKILVIQKVLLETSERVQIINKLITDQSYAQINDNYPNTATITLSDIDIPLKPVDKALKKKNKKYIENFLVTVSHGMELFVSDFIEEKSDLLKLDQKFTFQNMPPDFEIKVKLFWIRLKDYKKKTLLGRFFKKSTSKIIYQDHVMNEFQQKEVFKTSFQLVAETTLTRDQIDTSFSELMPYPKIFPRISGKIRHYMQCEIDTNADLSGFLDVGTRKNDLLIWCTKYCVLKETDFWIYNDPTDWQFGRDPIEKINLSFCFGPVTKKIDHCPKPRCFQLTTARPNNGSHNVTLKSKPNFMEMHFFFAAREKKEFEEWTMKLDQVYQSLRLFKKLFVNQEYEHYSKQHL